MEIIAFFNIFQTSINEEKYLKMNNKHQIKNNNTYFISVKIEIKFRHPFEEKIRHFFRIQWNSDLIWIILFQISMAKRTENFFVPSSSKIQYPDIDIKDIKRRNSNQSSAYPLGQFVKSRSKKKKLEFDFEISFQSSLLDSHITAFINIVQKYERKSSNILQLSNVNILYNSSQNKINFYTLKHEKESDIMSLYPFKKEDEKIQYIEDLNIQEELNNFLNFCYHSVRENIRNQIVYIILFLWEEFLLADKNLIKLKELVGNMKKSISGKIDQLLEKEELKNITFSSEDASFPQKIKNNFLILLTELAETVALVIEGYFDNPYEEMDKVQEGQQENGQLYIRKFSWLSLNQEDSEDKIGEESMKRVKNC